MDLFFRDCLKLLRRACKMDILFYKKLQEYADRKNCSVRVDELKAFPIQKGEPGCYSVELDFRANSQSTIQLKFDTNTFDVSKNSVNYNVFRTEMLEGSLKSVFLHDNFGNMEFELNQDVSRFYDVLRSFYKLKEEDTWYLIDQIGREMYGVYLSLRHNEVFDLKCRYPDKIVTRTVKNGSCRITIELSLNSRCIQHQSIDYQDFSKNLWSDPDLLNHVRIRCCDEMYIPDLLFKPTEKTTLDTFTNSIHRAVYLIYFDLFQIATTLQVLVDIAFAEYIGKIPKKEEYEVKRRRAWFETVEA